MSLTTQQLQAMFARRREVEHSRVERTAAVSRYYDHWGKVTNRFQNWTTPEYYQQAEGQVQKKKDDKQKAEKLEQRQEKLRQLLKTEERTYEAEQTSRTRPKGRTVNASTEMLRKIEENARDRENLRRRLDLEAKLYGKWRHGVDDENAIFESKSDHEVLAKLNWLDKQIEDQVQREKEASIAEDRKLRLQQEINQTEATHHERQKLREQEIKEIRALQERHMQELRSRQLETEELKAMEKQLRANFEAINKELELLEASSAATMEPAEMSHAYNLKKIKVLIRKRSENYRNEIQLIISMLQRTQPFASKASRLDELIAKYEVQLEVENYTLSQIEAWYESEAKYNLSRCEEMWQAQHMERYNDVKECLDVEQKALATELKENMDRQEELIDIRSTHLSAIENSNDKLKQIIEEQEQSPRGVDVVDVELAQLASPRSLQAANEPRVSTSISAPSLPHLTNSFTNLNLDVWQDLASARGGIDSPRLQTQRSLQIVTSDNAERPKFARKRVAWT